MRRSTRLRIVACLAWLSFATPGCTSSPFRSENWTWHKKPATIPGIKTADERIEELRAIAKRAPKMSNAEREQAAAGIAKEIQNENDLLVRIEMLKCLAVLPSPIAAAVLRSGLEDKDADVRIVCCQSWGKIGGEEAAMELARSLNSDTDVDVRLAAARALGETKSPSAIKVLGDALADSNPAMQARAMAGLKLASGKDYGNDVKAWRQFATGQPVDYQPPSLADRLKRVWK